MKEKERIDVLTQAMLIEESSLVQWISHYWRYLLWLLLATAILFLIFLRMNSSNAHDAEMDYLKADKEFKLFETGIETGNDSAFSVSLEKMQQVMKRHPELHAKYDGLIAQNLINAGQVERALPYAEKAIKRTETENNVHYSTYSAVTLLIAQNQIESALAKSLALQDALKQDAQQVDPLLHAFNLLRVAGLQKQLGMKQEEAQTWQAWKTLVNKGAKGMALQQLLDSLTENEIKFSDYVAAREKALTQE